MGADVERPDAALLDQWLAGQGFRAVALSGSAASQSRTCAAATGKAATVRTSAGVTPGRVTMLNATSNVCSAKICNGDPVARPSSVGNTDPSIEFSIGTQAKSATPSRTACSAAAGLSWGNGSILPGTAPDPVSASRAASVNVPSGPR